MPVRVNAAQYADKHNRRTKAAIEDMRAGVQRVTESPTAKAADAGTKMLEGIRQAVESGKWGNSLRAVSLEQWKTAMIEKGVPRVSQGLDAARAKIERTAAQLLAYENTVLEEIDRMPDLSIEDSVNRAAAWIRRMAQFVPGQ